MFQVFSAVAFGPVQTRPRPVLVMTEYKVDWPTLLETKPVAPCGRMRFVMLPDPARAPVYLMTGIVPRLTAARLMLLVPLSVNVPQLTSGDVVFVGTSASVAPGKVAVPVKIMLLKLAVVVPACAMDKTALLLTIVLPWSAVAVVICSVPALTLTVLE